MEREMKEKFLSVSSILWEKENEINELKTKLFLAEKRIKSLEGSLPQGTPQENNSVPPTEEKTLIIGDTNLHHINTSDLEENTIIRTLREANMSMLKSWIIEKLDQPIKECIIYCGMQDLMDDDYTPQVTTDSLGSIVMDLKEINENTIIKVCELVPSPISSELTSKINLHNSKVSEWCNSNDVVFIQTEKFFKLGTGDIDNNCFEYNNDSINDECLSRIGVVRLLDAISSACNGRIVSCEWSTQKQKKSEVNKRKPTKPLSSNQNAVSYRNTYSYSRGKNMAHSNRFSHNDNDRYRAQRSQFNWREPDNYVPNRINGYRPQVPSNRTYSSYHQNSAYKNRNRVGCYNCGEYNHVQSNCRFDHRMRCDVCQQYGHKSRFCQNSNRY